jgi:hypothetical protein
MVLKHAKNIVVCKNYDVSKQFRCIFYTIEKLAYTFPVLVSSKCYNVYIFTFYTFLNARSF